MYFIYILHTGQNNLMVNRTNMKYRTVGIKVIRYFYLMVRTCVRTCVDGM